MSLRKRILTFLAVFLAVFLLAACSKITQKNFDKIQVNMPMQEVIAILGEPTSTESLTIGGISGTSAVWKDNNGEIDIQFLNDRVIVKSFSRENDNTNNENKARPTTASERQQ